MNKDKEILEAIQSGQNGKVLNFLYKTSLPKISQYICANNGDEQEAKDIFQDAVISLFTTVKMGKFDTSKDIRGFLYFVARNLWINRIKRRNKQIDILDIDDPVLEETPFAIITSAEKKEKIDEVLSILGSSCQQILKYVIYDNLSMKEIAERMEFANETVAKSTHYRCKQKLVDMLSKNKEFIKLLKEK